jgi:hypothetical protein
MAQAVKANRRAYGNNVFHSFVRAADGTIATFDPPGAVLSEAQAINNEGWVTGTYIDSSSVTHGFLMVPRSRSHLTRRP